MMKKICMILLCCLMLLGAAMAADNLPEASFAQAKGSINCGMAYTLAVQVNSAPAADLSVVLRCDALGTAYTAIIPAGQTSAEVTIDIPQESKGQKLVFKLENGEGYTCKKGDHALQVFSLPRVVFYSPYAVGYYGDGREMTVRVECQNANAVLKDNNVFELRNSRGEVLDTMTWTNPSNVGSFKFLITEELLGKQTLSVWLNGTQVNTEAGYAFLSDPNLPRLDTLTPSEPAMSITIDCGSPSLLTKGQTEKVLAVLDKYNVKATFFFTGVFVETQTESAKMIRDAGHELGNHTYTHPRMTELSLRLAYQDMMRCTKLMEELLGVTPRLYRPPYGDTNGNTTALIRGEGMEETLWMIDSYDWNERFSHSQIIERVTNKKIGNGGIILFHLDGFKCEETLDIVLPYYQNELGCRLVPVSELMALSGRELQPMPDDREALVWTAEAE